MQCLAAQTRWRRQRDGFWFLDREREVLEIWLVHSIKLLKLVRRHLGLRGPVCLADQSAEYCERVDFNYAFNTQCMFFVLSCLLIEFADCLHEFTVLDLTLHPIPGFFHPRHSPPFPVATKAQPCRRQRCWYNLVIIYSWYCTVVFERNYTIRHNNTIDINRLYIYIWHLYACHTYFH